MKRTSLQPFAVYQNVCEFHSVQKLKNEKLLQFKCLNRLEGIKQILLGLLLSATFSANAQCLTNGTNVNNSNTGNVGAGTTTPIGILHIKSNKL